MDPVVPDSNKTAELAAETVDSAQATLQASQAEPALLPPLSADSKNIRPRTTAEQDRQMLAERAAGELREAALVNSAQRAQAAIEIAEALRSAGQRRVNLIWEATQATVAVLVTAATIYAALGGKESLVLGNAFTLIIALYFVRQNHSKVGGIGGDAAGSR